MVLLWLWLLLLGLLLRRLLLRRLMLTLLLAQLLLLLLLLLLQLALLLRGYRKGARRGRCKGIGVWVKGMHSLLQDVQSQEYGAG